MADATIFYSWQSDLEHKVTRSFLERALERALRDVSTRLGCRLAVDQDARGETGSPVIPDVIQEKIRRAVGFVADLSIVARRPAGGGLPNGCVAVEWGWAEERHGSEAMIGVMNTALGKPGDLPIDIRQSLIRTTFELSIDADAATAKKASESVQVELARSVEESLRARFFKGLRASAVPIIRHLITSNPDGGSWTQAKPREIAATAGIAEEDALALADDFDRLGLADVLSTRDRDMRLLPTLFIRFDPLFMGWSAAADSVEIAKVVADRTACTGAELSDRLSWPPRRINPALHLLIAHEIIDESAEVSVPYITHSVRTTEKTLAYAEGRLKIPRAT